MPNSPHVTKFDLILNSTDMLNKNVWLFSVFDSTENFKCTSIFFVQLRWDVVTLSRKGSSSSARSWHSSYTVWMFCSLILIFPPMRPLRPPTPLSFPPAETSCCTLHVFLSFSDSLYSGTLLAVLRWCFSAFGLLICVMLVILDSYLTSPYVFALPHFYTTFTVG